VVCRVVQGYGDLHAYNVAEAMFVVLYMFVSIGVAAYFVGTSVLLVQENERKTGAYRYIQDGAAFAAAAACHQGLGHWGYITCVCVHASTHTCWTRMIRDRKIRISCTYAVYYTIRIYGVCCTTAVFDPV
jgi:hypothetical protein